MISDDLTAAGAIALGTALSIAVTMSVIESEPAPIALIQSAPQWRPVPLVEHAIIVGPVDMVGPEGPHSGWAPSAVPALRPR